MDGFGHTFSSEHLIDRFSGQRNEGGSSLGKDQQGIVQGLISLFFVAVGVAFPEAAAAAADVPVGQIIDKSGVTVGRFLQIVVVKFCTQFRHHTGAGAQDPAVEDVGRIGRGLNFAGFGGVTVHIGIGGKEGQGVPHRDHHLTQDFTDTVFRETQIFRPDDR